jgi:hypothetical protein
LRCLLRMGLTYRLMRRIGSLGGAHIRVRDCGVGFSLDYLVFGCVCGRCGG